MHVKIQYNLECLTHFEMYNDMPIMQANQAGHNSHHCAAKCNEMR